MSVFEFKKTEERIREYWKSQRIFEKSLELRKDNKRFVFFEGPPTANGMPGVHHMLVRAFKDLYGRYKTMRGYFVLRKAGWDTHGLPVELEVEKELGFKNKKDIEAYGIAAFNKKARESVWKYKKEWEEMTERMAYWLDLQHPYATYETPYIESLWHIIKKIADRDLLYQAHRVVPFCTRCGTALSSHEVAQGYKVVKENSVYLKFKLKDEKYPNTSILAWTTTPWTLPGNLALAVGKDITYVLASTGSDKIILAKDLLEKVAEGYSIEKEISGSDLVGLEYEPLFDIPQLRSEKSYHVYAADFVSTQDGTGVVHTAVMYGEDDYKLGTDLGLPKVHTVDEQGKFMGVSPDLDGKYVKAKATEEIILEHLRTTGVLFKEMEYEHDYPFCWRCDTPLLYYAKTSWFIKMSAVNADMLENNQDINWVPAHLKEGRFGQWLKEGKDWAFSRERYWGTPLPVWQCTNADCKKHFVAGSLKDLQDHRYKKGNRFFLLRHGFTNRGDGKEGLTVSSRLENDTYELTQEGREQIKTVAAGLKGEDISMIVASPFKRTQQSAYLVGDALGVSVITEPGLGELNHGLACEGQSHLTCAIGDGFDERAQDGESRRQAQGRMVNVLKELDRAHEGKNILIVSHGDPLWLLQSALLNYAEEETFSKRNELFLSQGEFHVVEFPNYPFNDQGQVDLHRPYVDDIILKCEDCDSHMKKVPDLIDGWFDSGSMPYAQWHYPFESKDMLKQQFPADFIVEGVDQTRGWFYTLLAVSTLLGRGAPYKTVMSLGHVLDAQGKKMSKSKGNIVRPNDLMDTVGVDAGRWYFYTINSPGDPTLFEMKDVQGRLKGFLTTLENCVRFYELYESSAPRGDMELTKLDHWLLSKLNRTILDATERLDEYDPTTAARLIEKFIVEDISKWWLRRSRNRPEAIGMLRYILFVISKLTAPFIPYTAEDIYTRVGGRELGAVSVHLQDWPKGDKGMIDEDLEKTMEQVQSYITTGLGIRKEKQIKVRQPLQAVTLPGEPLHADLEMLVKDELNVKEVRYQSSGEIQLDLVVSPELQAEGYAREMIRQIQDMRKEAKYAFDDRVLARWHTEEGDLAEAIKHWEDMIEKETVLADLIQGKDNKDYDIEKEVELVPGKRVWIGVKK